MTLLWVLLFYSATCCSTNSLVSPPFLSNSCWAAVLFTWKRFISIRRSKVTEVSVQYTVHSSFSPASFSPQCCAARRTVPRQAVTGARQGSHVQGLINPQNNQGWNVKQISA